MLLQSKIGWNNNAEHNYLRYIEFQVMVQTRIIISLHDPTSHYSAVQSQNAVSAETCIILPFGFADHHCINIWTPLSYNMHVVAQ